MNDIEKLKVIEAVVCDYLKIPTEKIAIITHKREYTECRFAIFYYARKFTKLSQEKIGSRYNKDHASVCYGLTVIENLIKYNGWAKNHSILLARINIKISYLNMFEWIPEFSDHVANFMITEQ